MRERKCLTNKDLFFDLTKNILEGLNKHEFDVQQPLTQYLPKEEDFKISKKFVQNWSAYNDSQTKEKILFMQLLRELCETIEILPHNKRRRPK